MSLDRVKLTKVLNLTLSDMDGEAVSAIRMANKLIKNAGLTWEKLLSGQAETKTNARASDWKDYGFKTEQTKKEEPKPKYEQRKQDRWFDEGPTVDEMFEKCLNEQPDNEFLQSINEYYLRNKFLTPKQKAALEKFYDRIVSF